MPTDALESDMPNNNASQPETQADVLAFYETKVERQAAILKQASRRWDLFCFVRGGVFLASVVPLFLGMFGGESHSTLWFVLAGLFFLAFLATAAWHEAMAKRIRISKLLLKMDRESVARCQRDWANIKPPPVSPPKDRKAICVDLDLIGEGSLYKLLGTARTPLGIATIADWIVHGTDDVAEISARQDAVAEMAPRHSYRESFNLLCAQLGGSLTGPDRFVNWANSSTWFENRSWVLMTARTTIAVLLVSGLLFLTGVVPATVAALICLVCVVINFVLAVAYAGAMHETINAVAANQYEMSHYVSLFQMVTEFEPKSEYLRNIRQELIQDGDDIRQHIRQLSWITWLANWRRNSLFFVPYLFMQFLCFWDAHVLNLLDRWKQKHGSKAERWFGALGRWEAILCLAKLAHDQPAWNFPEVQQRPKLEAKISAVRLGHPLLGEERVANDVSVGPPGNVLLVTGSNMSGKSTLLRSIGVNVVLAQMGSVVCAKSLSLSPLRIETSMRVVDSLTDGVSFFMAELKRLKTIVDVAKGQQASEKQAMLFLLDEILQGTNSRERQIAVSRVVRKLIDEDAIGAISTHDLDLATADDLREACQTVHFSEQFKEVDGKRKMTFDYQMKPGLSETTNALTLLEMVGLGE